MAALPQAVNMRAFSETYEDTFAEYEPTAADFTAFAYEGDALSPAQVERHMAKAGSRAAAGGFGLLAMGVGKVLNIK